MKVHPPLSFCYKSRLVISLWNGPNLLVYQIITRFVLSCESALTGIIDVICHYLLLSSSFTHRSLTGMDQSSHLGFIRDQVLDLQVCVFFYSFVKVCVSCCSPPLLSVCTIFLKTDEFTWISTCVNLCICAFLHWYLCVCVFVYLYIGICVFAHLCICMYLYLYLSPPPPPPLCAV